MSAADLALRPRGTSAWWFFDPVVGAALRAVGYRDCTALVESEGLKRVSHRAVVFVGVAAQVVRALCCELEDRPSDTVSAYRKPRGE